ncbi:hypothetical protein [Paraliomyxa miuraensis]|uniref:hypothetical protein n=1 Tax=Paraliomyxa miuraensis TaxID=376150 RepID=UPI0022594A80|nr:hypothetical protein [Paraliomyxa miuraensis]MCX4239360.1 hypothetical protein [Paraliomyxa miuraensis]
MKTLRLALLGLGIATLCASGCAERPGQKKDDDKKADKKDGSGKDDKKTDKKS